MARLQQRYAAAHVALEAEHHADVAFLAGSAPERITSAAATCELLQWGSSFSVDGTPLLVALAEMETQQARYKVFAEHLHTIRRTRIGGLFVEPPAHG